MLSFEIFLTALQRLDYHLICAGEKSAHAKYGQKFNLLSHMKVFQRKQLQNFWLKSDGVNFLII